MSKWAATAVCLTLTAGLAAVPRRADTVRAGGAIAVVLAEGRLVIFDVAGGVQLAEYAASPPPRYALTSGRIARSVSGDEIFAVLPDTDGPVVVAVDTRTFAGRKIGRLPADLYPALAAGRATGRLYAFGSFNASVVVLHSRTGQELTRLAHANGRDVYGGGLSADERRIYVSYHGRGTGIDWFDVTAEGWRQAGYVATHGNVVIAADAVLAATGDEEILELDGSGKRVGTIHTGLHQNHLMEFAVDHDRRMIYAAGSCSYAGGLSVTPWPRAGAKPKPARMLVPPGDYSVCGERVALAPEGTWVAVALLEGGNVNPLATRPGAVLVIDTKTGAIARRIATSSDVVDVLAIR